MVNSASIGTITFESGDVWTSTDPESDGGYYVQAGKSVSLEMTTGGDGTGGCIFAGKASKAGTSIGTDTKPGQWICPGYSTSGSWEVEPEASSVNRHGDSFKHSADASRVLNTITPGTYKWKLTNSGDKSKGLTITFSAGNTYTSTLSTDDSGSWVEAGKAITFDITAGGDTGQDCLFAGKVSASGTSIGTTANPGTWVCPGYGTSGTWTAS
jgi:hypothetical protein